MKSIKTLSIFEKKIRLDYKNLKFAILGIKIGQRTPEEDLLDKNLVI